MEDHVKFLADREITDELTHGVGFSPKDNKWYGWGHRAICGFTVGSECKKGSCHYTADNPEEMIEDHANFFANISEECAEEHRAECQILPDRSRIQILHSPMVLLSITDINDLEATIDRDESVLTDIDISSIGPGYHAIKCGRGEWVAKTMEDAKQMAIDFNEGVS